MIDEFIEYVKEVWGVDLVVKPSTESSDTFESLFCNIMEVHDDKQ